MSSLRTIEALVSGGESERVEFKRSTVQRSEAAKAVCAMLNGLGGFVLFGVTNKGEIVGQQVTAKTMEDITAELRRIEPPAFPDIETITLESGASVIVLNVPGRQGTYAYDGRLYVRQGPTTIVMPRDEHEKRIVEKFHATRRWENEPVADGVTMHDLDADEIQRTIEDAIRLGRIDPAIRRDPESILRGLELIQEDRLLNAAVALYGNSQQLRVVYPQMGIRLGRFRGRNRLADFADNRQYWDHAFGLLRRGESFLMDHVPIAGRVISGKMIREDQPWYPPRATREALANALCHRDYTIPGGAVAVAMYDDHLEITNPGDLHFGITPEKLTVPHESKPWNPIIANVFYRAGIIERWGSGTLNIMDWCKENANPVPTWHEQAGSVYVTFLPAVLPEDVQSGPPSTPHVTPPVRPRGEGPESGPESIKGRVIAALANQPLSKSEIATAIGQASISGKLNQRIRQMLAEELIEYTVPDKPNSRLQKYRLTEKGREIMKAERKGKEVGP
jgi:ATP-dependent DNA helicase RecG